MVGYPKILSMFAQGASTAALRGACMEAAAAGLAITAVAQATNAGRRSWLSSKASARFMHLATDTMHAYGMVVRAPTGEFFTVIVDIGGETLCLEGVTVRPVSIKIVKGWVEKTSLLDEDLPVVFTHDHGTVPSDCQGSDKQKEYLGMAQDSSAPDSKRADAMEIPFLGGNGVSGTLVLDRQGTMSQLVFLPYAAVDQVDTLRGCAADTAKKMPPPSTGVVVDLPAWWTMPVLRQEGADLASATVEFDIDAELASAAVDHGA